MSYSKYQTGHTDIYDLAMKFVEMAVKVLQGTFYWTAHVNMKREINTPKRDLTIKRVETH